MSKYDLHNNILQKVARNTAAISSTTTTAGNIIDTQGFESLEFLLHTGAWTDGTFTPLVEHGDAANLSDAAAVDDDDLLGTEAGAALAAANSSSRIGYRGSKRYVRLSVVSSGVTSGATVGATAILGHPHLAATVAA